VNKTEQQREHFESISSEYFQARKHPSHLLIKQFIWEYFFARAGLPQEHYNVLEPMCGYAEGKTILESYAKLDVVYTGFDYSQTLIDLVKHEQPDLNIFWQDVMSIDGERFAGKFDLVILIGGLHHVYDKTDVVLKKIAATLKDGGYFINFEPTHNFAPFRMAREYIYNRNKLFDEETEQAYDLAALNRLYVEGGFEVVEQIYPGLLAYVLYYNPDAFPLLNRGGALAVKAAFALDRLFVRNFVGRKFSFATMSLLRKLPA